MGTVLGSIRILRRKVLLLICRFLRWLAGGSGAEIVNVLEMSDTRARAAEIIYGDGDDLLWEQAVEIVDVLIWEGLIEV